MEQRQQHPHHQHHRVSREQDHDQRSSHPSHGSQHYPSQRPQQHDYPARAQSPPPPPSPYYRGNGYSGEDRRPYHPYPESYSSSYPKPAVRHTEGYEGRVRNTNRDHNDHLLTTSDHFSNTHDQQQHHDRYRRDPTHGYLEHQSPSQYPPSLADDRRRGSSGAYEDGFDKFHLPPILAPPEEPFYRKDLPGRHMRYFRNVTSQDREDRFGYYSSARHVAPSNTTGNFGHGPPLADVLDRFGAKQAQLRQQEQQQQQRQQQQHQQQQQQQQQSPQQQKEQPHGARLPSLYTALPEQRPANAPNHTHPYPDSSSSEQSSPSAVSPSHHRSSFQQQHSPLHSPAEKTAGYGRPHQQQTYQQQQQQQQIKPKAIQPRSIAPAPVSSLSPTSPEMQQPAVSPRGPSKRSDRQIYVKIEPKEQAYYPSSQAQHQQQQRRASSPAAHQVKRKWDRDHSPIRQTARPNNGPTSPLDSKMADESSQELHLLSRRSQFAHPTQRSQDLLIKKGGQSQMTRLQRYQMTTIRCWHGAIAQKSYGIEKRYLCPPPMVHVSAGVNSKQIRAEQPHVTMSVIHEKVSGPHHGENLMEQDCTLDDGLKCSFRNLHVTGTGSDSSKRFKLGLQVFLNKHAAMPTAIMDSNPIPIISKPSKKTAKAGNASCFILNGMSVSLLNRINAQTVRTKYMAVDNNAVCAKIGSWSSFTIKMVKPPPAPPVKTVPASMGVFRAPSHSTKFVPIRMKGDPATPLTPAQGGQAAPMARSLSNQHTESNGSNGSMSASSILYRSQQQHLQLQLQQEPVYVFSNSEPVLYGSEIVLINDLTGIMTDRLIIRKVENGKVSRSGTGPVSQMQKIVLEHPDRIHPEDGRAYYLSASSIGSPKIEGKIPLQAAMDRSPLLEYRTSSKKASIMDMTDSIDDQEQEQDQEEMNGEEANGDYHGQNNSMPKRVGKNQDSVSVDDFVCWTIAGIAKFDYTYFGPIPSSIDTDVDASKVPAVLSCPRYNPQTNTMTMPVKNVFEKLTSEEEARLSKQQEDPYERRLTLSEYVYKRCEDTRQPMRDEEGPIQLWLAQHGPIRLRRRKLSDVVTASEEQQLTENDGESADEDEEDAEDQEEQGDHGEDREDNAGRSSISEDRLPKIATKSVVPRTNVNTTSNANVNTTNNVQQQPMINAANGRHYGGSHLPASMNPALQNRKARKIVKRAMGLEAELPYGCEVRAAHDSQGNAKAELDILMVERASGIAYRTGFKVVYSRERERADWIVEVVG
ncbi:hypothetical protein BGZ98_000841 [Dissophora globulifera]|nr:hypothetical protein BGZ98_000841 [Dissophora globulifera]